MLPLSSPSATESAPSLKLFYMPLISSRYHKPTTYKHVSVYGDLSAVHYFIFIALSDKIFKRYIDGWY